MSIATGNFTAAGTWGTVDSTSYNNTETTTTALTTSYQTSSTFTPGAITIDGIAVKLSVRTGTTGTITVALDLATVDVVGTVVTINTADLPVAATVDLNGGWIFFKFSAPVTLAGATAYGVKAKTSSAAQISLFSTATTNWARALRTTTTAAPGAGDDLIVCGEYTGAGASNSFTVTMNETATTDYGAASTSLVTPSLAICSKGTLSYGTTASTNYYLRQSGNVIVYSGGTFNIGTNGGEIPRNGSAMLNFDCGANVDFGLTVRNLGTFNAYGLSRTSGKDIVSCKLNTDEAIASTSLGVDTDTGWLDNDEIVVATTTQTASQCEKGTLNGGAGASTLTVDGFGGAGGGLANAHSGTSPTQAEVILLTRNVQIFGASASFNSYIDIKDAATVFLSWIQCKWLGSGTANKRGVGCATLTGTVTIQYCSFHEFGTSAIGLNFSGISGNGFTHTYNVAYLPVGSGIIVSATANTTWSIDHYIGLRGDITLSDVGGTFTNNTLAGASLTISEAAGSLGTFSTIAVHGSLSAGITLTQTMQGTMTALTLWRNAGGLNISNVEDMVFDGLTLFGNASQNIQFVASAGRTVFLNPIANGDTTFATTNGIFFNSGTNAIWGEIQIKGGNFGTVGGIKTAHTNDFNINASPMFMRLTMNNTILASATEILNVTFISQSSFIASQAHDQTTGNHKTWKAYGILARETGTVHTGSQSLKMTPNSASRKLESSSFLVAVANGATLTPTVYVYEDASYNGARSRLILKRNDAIGVTSDTVIDTATASSDAAWEGLTGTTAAATDDGVMEFVVDCDGTAGNLFVDSFSVA